MDRCRLGEAAFTASFPDQPSLVGIHQADSARWKNVVPNSRLQPLRYDRRTGVNFCDFGFPEESNQVTPRRRLSGSWSVLESYFVNF
jgi:hypothetical protein